MTLKKQKNLLYSPIYLLVRYLLEVWAYRLQILRGGWGLPKYGPKQG